MTETIDELSFVALDDRGLPHSRAQIVNVSWGWQVELYQVPPDRRPPVHQVGVITFETLDGYRYAGTVVADLVSEKKGFVLLSGIGQPRLIASTRAA